MNYARSCRAVRFYESECSIVKPYTDSDILEEVVRELLAFLIVYVTRKPSLLRNFTVGISIRTKWEIGNMLR